MGSHYHGETQYAFGHDRVTWSVRTLILANIAIFALGLVATLGLRVLLGATGENFIVDWLAFSRDGFLGGKIWTVATYMFFHIGLWHLTMNMIMLYFFGPDVERTLGTRQFLYFFLFCGIVGVMLNLVPFSRSVPIIGASGAILGVLVAFAIIDPERQVFLLFLPVPINARALVFLMIVLNVVMSIGSSGTSVTTHFGGMAAGYIFMKGLPKFNQWRAIRRMPKQSGPTRDDMDKLGEEIDNILQFKNQDRR